MSHIEDLRNLRNRLIHFTATLDIAQTKSLVAQTMAFCVEFCEQQNMITPDSENKLGEIHINLTELQEFVDDRMTSILEEWKDAFIWGCPECWQSALVVDGGEQECKFCRYKADAQDLAGDFSEYDIEDCPECGEMATFAFVLYGNHAGTWVCFSCGEHSKYYDHCLRCNGMAYFPDKGDVEICGNCWSDIMSRG